MMLITIFISPVAQNLICFHPRLLDPVEYLNYRIKDCSNESHIFEDVINNMTLIITGSVIEIVQIPLSNRYLQDFVHSS